MLRRFFYIFTFIIFLSVGFSARAYSNPGKPTGFVNDYAGMLNATQISQLNQKLTQFSQDTSNEISVVTIKSLDGDTIENFSNKLFTDWKIGKDKKDNGVLLLIALDERQMRIEPGYGLEGALPDATCFQIIDQTLKPAFRSSDYYGGINSALDQIILATKGEYTADTTDTTNSGLSGSDSFGVIFFLIILIFNLLNLLWRHLAKSRSWWEGGLFGIAVGLILALIFLRTLIYFIVLPIGMAIFGLIIDYLVSRVLPKPKPGSKNNNFWLFGGGGGSNGGLGGGGGFGGFGGGGSGGGGASGGW
jgi:uncharacterized protein